MKHAQHGEGPSSRLVNRLREFSPTDTRMASILVHFIENNMTKVKGHHLHSVLRTDR